MRNFYRTLRIFASITLFFFCWTYLPIWQAVAFAAGPQMRNADFGLRNENQKGRVAADFSPHDSNAAKFEKSLEEIREKVGKAEVKAGRGETVAEEIQAIKAKKAEIESIDVELRKEFAATEKKLKNAKLPQEILDRHTKFVKNYTDNLAELKTNLIAVENSSATSNELRAALQKAKLHLEKTKPPKSHVPLDPNKLPFRTVKAKARAPRLKKEDFEKEFGTQKQNKLAADNSRSVLENTKSVGCKNARKAQKPQSEIQLALNSCEWARIKYKPFLIAYNEFASDRPLQLPLKSYKNAALPVGWDERGIPQFALNGSSLLLAQATADTPTPGDLAESPEVQFTQDIRDLALQLDNSPVKIFEWVKNNIEFVPTYGSIQGADMCLQSKQCNDIDTASLLIALLRVSNIPAHYVYGTIEVPIDKAMNWTGGFTDARAALNFVASGNVPVASLIKGGTIIGAQMEHVWVEAYIPYGNYRGAIMDQSLKTWIPIDGSFKQYTYTNGFDMTTTIPFSQDAYLSQVQGQDAVHYYQSQIRSYLDANMPDSSIVDVKGYREITQETYHFLPSTLPYVTAAQLGKFSIVPDDMATKLTFSLANSTTESSISYTVTTSEVAGKRVTVSYIPVSSDDETLIANYGGFLYNVPAYMLNLKPVLRVEGTIRLAGEAKTLGSAQTLTLQFTQPNGNTEIRDKKLLAGAYYAVGIDLQGINENVLGKRNYHLNTSIFSQTAGTLGNDDLIGEHLFILATTYFLANDKEQKSGAKVYNVATATTISEGITSFTLTVANTFGVPISAMPSGINMDVAMSGVIVSALDGNTRKELAYMDVHGLAGSYNEHDIFEKIDGFSSVSAVKALQTAAANGILIQKITSGNISQLLPTLQVSDEIKADIQNGVIAGKEVTISQSNIQINDWNGVGYIIKDAVTGAGAYMISGGLAGSNSTNKQDGYQIVQLHKEPYGWVKDRTDPQARNTIVSVATWEDGELALNEGAIKNAIVSSINFCSTYSGVGQCSGLVYKAYKAAGIYLFGESLRREGGNYKDGLDIIWGIPQTGYQTDILVALTNAQKIYKNAGVRKSNDPLKGDIVFFENTYLRDKTNGISQQGITHVGIVMDVPGSDGNIRFAQASVHAGVVTDSTLNIVDPTAFSTMMRTTPTPARASQLFAGFGTIRYVLPNILSLTGN